MALMIDGPNSTIHVPQADLTYDPGGMVYKLDVDAFRLELKGWEDSPEGMAWTKTHNHNTEQTFAGTTFARQVIILQPWQIQFENTGSAYTVVFEGANNNLLDGNVLLPTPLVSYVSTNSAGLIVREGDTSGLTPQEAADLAEILKLMKAGRLYPDGKLQILDTDNTTVILEADAWEDVAGTTPHSGGAIRKSDTLTDPTP